MALRARKRRAEGWWQVQKETPGALVLSPASLEGPNPSAAPPTHADAANTQKSSQTSPQAAFSSRIPQIPHTKHLPETSSTCPAVAPDGKTSTSQTSPLRATGTRGRAHPSALKILLNASSKTGRGSLKLISLCRSYATFNNI